VTYMLGDMLRWHRLATGMTGVEVAAAMGVSPSTVSRWENNEYSITVVQLRLLALVLAIPDYWNLLKP
jgi:transcriptional regulator with XRE-family HTH domain